MKILAQLIFFLFLFNLTDTMQAQNYKPVRLEVPADINVESFHVEMLGKKGVLIFYESNEVTTENQRKWFFGLFDTGLNQQWLKYIPLTDKLEYVKSSKTEGNLYLLFRNASRGRTEDGAYEVVSFNLLSDAFGKVTGTFPARAEIAGFEAIGNTGCLAINLKQDKSDLLFVDLTTGDISPVHVEQDFDTYIENLHADENQGRFYVGLKIIKDNRYISDEILRFTKQGSKDREYDVNIEQGGRYLNKYVIVPDKNDQLKVFGIYDIINKRVTSFRDLQNSDEAKSAGMFYLQFNRNEQTALKFYDFMNFNHLYGSVNGRSADNNGLSDNNSQANQKKMTTYYNLYDPEVIRSGNQYLFSAEIYQPYYTTETRMEYDFYGRPIPSTYQIFAGYDFIDVVVVCLSEDGEMVWNNDYAIHDLRTYKLARQSIVFTDDDFTSVAYVNNGKVVLQTSEGPVDVGMVETDIETKYERDRVAEDNFNHVKYWYDKYFLVYGYQTLKNRALDDKNNRSAFYVNKIAYN